MNKCSGCAKSLLEELFSQTQWQSGDSQTVLDLYESKTEWNKVIDNKPYIPKNTFPVLSLDFLWDKIHN